MHSNLRKSHPDMNRTDMWYIPSNDTSTDPLFDTLFRLYPDDPSIGSPYDPYNASVTDRFFGPTSQFKRSASIYGDSIFQAGASLMHS